MGTEARLRSSDMTLESVTARSIPPGGGSGRAPSCSMLDMVLWSACRCNQLRVYASSSGGGLRIGLRTSRERGLLPWLWTLWTSASLTTLSPSGSPSS
eukprot:scaffold279_cov229-Pinguiococcus_pyrenoidosus.AAC.5